MRMEVVADRGVRASIAVLLGLTAACVAWLAAYWVWQVLARPPSLPTLVVENDPESLAREVGVKHIFGVSGGLTGAVVALSSSVQLTLAGIVSSANDKRGVAIILLDGKKAVTARVGQEIAPDLVLSRVGKDHVELTRHGQTINLPLSTKK